MKTTYTDLFLQLAQNNTQIFGKNMKEINTEFNSSVFALVSKYETEEGIKEVQHVIPWSSVTYLEITEKLFRVMLR